MNVNSDRISEKAYYTCKKNPKSEAYKEITSPQWALMYCRFIKDRAKVRGRINTSETASVYCEKVKNDPKVRKYIK
jgi:hypothetical protein